MVYYEQRPPRQEEPPGCLETLLITRIVFGILLVPLLVLGLVLADLFLIFWLYTTYAPLALIPVALTAVAIWLFARWERSRFRPPEP